MEYIILGHVNVDVDSIVSGYLLEKIMTKKGYKASFVIPDEEVAKESENLCSKYDLSLYQFKNRQLKDDAKYILVDHNVRDVPGEIVAVIDHHPILDGEKKDNYYIEEASSTACMIAMDNEEYLNKHDIELACLATFVDTASFHSTKTRKTDISWINEMCTKYEFDYDKLYVDGLCLTSLKDVDEILFNGFKAYEFDNFIVHSSYIQVADKNKSNEVVDAIIGKLKDYMCDKKIDLYAFIVYDMSSFYTKVYEISKDSVDTSEYNLYASRGNTVIPDIKKKYC